MCLYIVCVIVIHYRVEEASVARAVVSVVAAPRRRTVIRAVYERAVKAYITLRTLVTGTVYIHYADARLTRTANTVAPRPGVAETGGHER